VRNLLYQVKVKLYAEYADVSSVNVENDQIVVRFRDATPPANLPHINPRVRIGKTGLWLPYPSLPDWRQVLLELLQALSKRQLI
jgi:transcription-repair coupling factor (superfamily II helicase)